MLPRVPGGTEQEFVGDDMQPVSLVRRIVALATALGLLAMCSVGAALAQTAPTSKAPPPSYIVVHITDAGFDKPAYGPVSYPISTSGLDRPTVEFRNIGTVVHTATAYPGTKGNTFLQVKYDAQGSALQCFAATQKCKGIQALDTGGIEPGGKAIVSFLPGFGDVKGLYTFTSATDCLHGNSNPQFNCTPATVQINGQAPPPDWNGSAFNYAGADDCVIGTVIAPPGGTATCQSTSRHWQTPQGGPTKPASGNITINIDDVKGFQPTVIWATMGSTFTFVNTGRNDHTVDPMVNCMFSKSGCAWWGPFWGDGYDLAPGQSWVWQTPGSAGASPNTSDPPGSLFVQYIGSQAPNDKLFGWSTGLPGGQGFGACIKSLSPQLCGLSGMTASIYLVAPRNQ